MPSFECIETFSHVAKATTIRVVLTVILTRGWYVRQIDVNTAFLNAKLVDEVYMVQPQGFDYPNYPKRVCKVLKSIYGLKQEPRAWFEKLQTGLVHLHLKASRTDLISLFIRGTSQSQLIVVIYVDVILVTHHSKNEVEEVIREFSATFLLKDLVVLSFFFLGIEVISNATGLLLCQEKYTNDLFVKAKMHNFRPCATPMTSGLKLAGYDSDNMLDAQLYMSIVGGLQYVIITLA